MSVVILIWPSQSLSLFHLPSIILPILCSPVFHPKCTLKNSALSQWVCFLLSFAQHFWTWRSQHLFWVSDSPALTDVLFLSQWLFLPSIQQFKSDSWVSSITLSPPHLTLSVSHPIRVVLNPLYLTLSFPVVIATFKAFIVSHLPPKEPSSFSSSSFSSLSVSLLTYPFK